MSLSPRELSYLASLVGVLLIFHRLKRFFLLFSLLLLPGTFCHELCHFCVGGLLNGRPKHFTIKPQKEGAGYVMGSVAFAHVRWYNAFFLGIAPLLLLPLAYALLAWRLKGHPAFGWGEGLALYLIANLIYASLPSWQDLRVAARSPIGWLLLAGLAAYGWHRVQAPPRTMSRFLERVVTRFSTIEPNTESERLPETRLGSWRSVSRFPSTA
jgi:hypothetical protein